jgi:hypothetical protein
MKAAKQGIGRCYLRAFVLKNHPVSMVGKLGCYGNIAHYGGESRAPEDFSLPAVQG